MPTKPTPDDSLPAKRLDLPKSQTNSRRHHTSLANQRCLNSPVTQTRQQSHAVDEAVEAVGSGYIGVGADFVSDAFIKRIDLIGRRKHYGQSLHGRQLVHGQAKLEAV